MKAIFVLNFIILTSALDPNVVFNLVNGKITKGKVLDYEYDLIGEISNFPLDLDEYYTILMRFNLYPNLKVKIELIFAPKLQNLKMLECRAKSVDLDKIWTTKISFDITDALRNVLMEIYNCNAKTEKIYGNFNLTKSEEVSFAWLNISWPKEILASFEITSDLSEEFDNCNKEVPESFILNDEESNVLFFIVVGLFSAPLLALFLFDSGKYLMRKMKQRRSTQNAATLFRRNPNFPGIQSDSQC